MTSQVDLYSLIPFIARAGAGLTSMVVVFRASRKALPAVRTYPLLDRYAAGAYFLAFEFFMAAYIVTGDVWLSLFPVGIIFSLYIIFYVVYWIKVLFFSGGKEL